MSTNSRNTRTGEPKPARGGTHSGPKRPVVLSLEESTKKTEDSVPLLVSLPPARQRTQTTICPMSPMTPDLDIDDESPGSSQSSSSSMFTFDLLSPTTPHNDRGFSFTACPTSPLDESMVYAFPPRRRPASTSFPIRSWGFPTDHNDPPVEFDTPLAEDPLREGMPSPSDDRKFFHVQFLQEDSPFPKTPDF